MTIVQVHDADRKAQIASDVLYDLPEWFGVPDSTKEYIEHSKKLSLWAAERNNEAVGFITLTDTSPDTAQIHCMGVKKAFHRFGIGSLLYSTLEAFAKTKYKFIQVKTVDEGKYKEYDQTIGFYKKMGFSKFEVFPAFWDEWNPCLVMVKSLAENKNDEK
ncbi:MAG: GNAT family N-acetyltransferase [Christensenellales bacterium]